MTSEQSGIDDMSRVAGVDDASETEVAPRGC